MPDDDLMTEDEWLERLIEIVEGDDDTVSSGEVRQQDG